MPQGQYFDSLGSIYVWDYVLRSVLLYMLTMTRPVRLYNV